jgi:hypothetical protein
VSSFDVVEQACHTLELLSMCLFISDTLIPAENGSRIETTYVYNYIRTW